MRYSPLILMLLLLPACYRETEKAMQKNAMIQEQKTNGVELDFYVTNQTNKTLYVACFYYAVKQIRTRWSWYKTPVYEIKPGDKILIDIHTIAEKKEMKNIYGYLGIFENKGEAEASIYELLEDKNKIELSKLLHLKKSNILLQTESYGFKGETLDWEHEKNGLNKNIKHKELDFLVENQTEKDLYITCFVYQQELDHGHWVFDKTDVIEIKSGQGKFIDVDTLRVPKDAWESVIGILGVFEHDKKEDADKSTFELLKPDQKLIVGYLKRYQDKKVVIIPKKYGALSGFDNQYPKVEFERKSIK
ncbi:hypothetical protein KAW80_04165 [Candidatus Babeliales bacterium]|nr:hypothetical protein [Candidatus Babeliales bacterium]